MKILERIFDFFGRIFKSIKQLITIMKLIAILIFIAITVVLSVIVLIATWYFYCEIVFYGILASWTMFLAFVFFTHPIKSFEFEYFRSMCDPLNTRTKVLLCYLPIALIALVGYWHFSIPQPTNDTEPWIQCHLDTTHIQDIQKPVTEPVTFPMQTPLPIERFEQLTPYEAALYYAAHWEEDDNVANYYASTFADFVSYIDYEELKPISQLLVNTPLAGQADKYIQAQWELRLKEIAETLEQQREIILQYYKEDVATAVKFTLDSVLYDEAEQLIDDYKGMPFFGSLQMFLGKGSKYMTARWFEHLGKSSTTSQTAFTDYISVYNEMLTELRKEAIQGYLPGIELKYTTSVADFKYRYPYTEDISKAADAFINNSNWEDGRDLLLDLIGFIPGVGNLISIGATGWIIYDALTSEEATPKQIVCAAMVVGCFENIDRSFERQAAFLEKQLQSEDEQFMKLIAERL